MTGRTRRLAAGALAVLLFLGLGASSCLGGDTPTQLRATTAPRMQVAKISEVNYDNTVYYGHYRFTDSTGTYECFVADNSASSGDASAGGFAMSCLPRTPTSEPGASP